MPRPRSYASACRAPDEPIPEDAIEIGTLGVGDRDVVELADLEIDRNPDHAVDLRRLAMAAADTRPVDEHLDSGTDEVTPAPRRDAILQLGELGQPFGHHLGRYRPIEP